MNNRCVAGLSLGKKFVLTIAGTRALMVTITIGALDAQDVPDWQTKAGAKMTFEVASVKLSTAKELGPLANVSLDAGERYQPTGGWTFELTFRCGPTFNSHISFGRRRKISRTRSIVCRSGSGPTATALKRVRSARTGEE